MQSKENWSKLSPLQLYEEITKRRKLIGEMVGTLYPSIVNDELDELNKLYAEIPIELCLILEGLKCREEGKNWCPSEESYQARSIKQDGDIKFLLDRLQSASIKCEYLLSQLKRVAPYSEIAHDAINRVERIAILNKKGLTTEAAQALLYLKKQTI